MVVYDRWHKVHPKPDEKKCSAHRKVPSAEHGRGLRWQVRGIDQDGQPFKQNFEFEQDAKDKDAELRAAVRAGMFVDERAGKVTFRQFAEDWRKNRVHDPSTAERIRSTFTNHVYAATGSGAVKGKTPKGGNAIGDIPMRTLARRISLSQQWISSIPLAPNSALQLIKDVGQVYRAAVDDKIIGSNPLAAPTIQKPDAVKHAAVAWTQDELEAVASHLPPSMEAMPYLGSSCGHRQGELSAVAIADLDFLRKTCHIEFQVKRVKLTGISDVTKPKRSRTLTGWHLVFAPTKNEKIRDVPVADKAIIAMSEHIAMFRPAAVTLPFLRHDGRIDGDVTRMLVFHNHGEPWYGGTIRAPWNRACKAAGIPDAPQVNGWHVTRHTAASRWLSGGLSLAKTAFYLGDTQEVVLSTYSHFMPEEEDRAREIMNACFERRNERASALRMPYTSSEGVLWLLMALSHHSQPKWWSSSPSSGSSVKPMTWP